MGDGMTYENLLLKAENLGLKVKEFNLKTKDGYCKGDRIIINNNLLTNVEKKCILAEEIAHYELTVGDITEQKIIENRKQEIKARRHSYKFLVEPIDLIYAFRSGVKNRYELAEFLDVTEEILESIISEFRKIYGTGVQMYDYYLQLEPFLGVCKRY